MNKTDSGAEVQSPSCELLQQQIDCLRTQLQPPQARRCSLFHDEKIELLRNEAGHELVRLKQQKRDSIANPELSQELSELRTQNLALQQQLDSAKR